MTKSIPDHTRLHSPVVPNMVIVAGMILAAALFRVAGHFHLIPFPPNFTPIGAMALFGGAALANRRQALLFPLTAMFLSDLLIGFDKSRVWVYGSIVLITLLGRLLQNRRRNPASVAVGALGAAVLFFLITNFGVWLTSGMYGYSFSEFVRCYTMALPFFRNTLAGDLVFSAALFGGLAFLESRVPSTVSAPLES